MTSIGRREEVQKDAFQILNKSRITRRDSREDTGHSLAPAMKRSGTELSARHLKDTRIPSAQRWWDVSKETGHPVSKSISALGRGILKRVGGRDTIHFNADSSNTELLSRTNHSNKSAQYLRISLKLVHRVRSTDSESKRVDCG